MHNNYAIDFRHVYHRDNYYNTMCAVHDIYHTMTCVVLVNYLTIK